MSRLCSSSKPLCTLGGELVSQKIYFDIVRLVPYTPESGEREKNLKEGWIFCEWEASNQDTLEKILKESKLPCEDVVEVEEMTPEEGRWEMFGELEE